MPKKRQVTSEEFASLHPEWKGWWKSPISHRYFKVEAVDHPGASRIRIKICRTSKTMTRGFVFLANRDEIHVSSQA